MEVLSQNMWGKTLREIGKIGFKTSLKSCLKLAKIASFYKATKTNHWGKSPGQITCRSTGWSTGQRSYLWPLGLPFYHLVDRTQVLTYRLTGRSTGQSTSRSTKARTREQSSLAGRPGPDPESKLSGLVDRRSTGPQTKAVYTFCAHRSTARLINFWLGRPLNRPPEGQVRNN